MTSDQYHEQVLSTLDTMRTAEKDHLILGFIAALYPRGDPDHHVIGSDFIAEAIRLLAPFHPNQLVRVDQANTIDSATVPEF